MLNLAKYGTFVDGNKLADAVLAGEVAVSDVDLGSEPCGTCGKVLPVMDMTMLGNGKSFCHECSEDAILADAIS